MRLAQRLYSLSLHTYYTLLRAVAWFHPRASYFFESRKANASIPVEWSSAKHRVIWFHCASLGEFEQGRPVLEAFREQYPDWKIVLTFYSPSGFEHRKNYAQADWVTYLPLDYPERAQAFVDKINPEIALFVKYEFWYFHLHELNKRGVKIGLIAGIFRPNQPFFRFYGFFHRRILAFFSHFFLQTQSSLALLQGVGIRGISLSGDTRFDRVLAVREKFIPIPSVEQFCNGQQAIVLGSVWPEDRALFAGMIQASTENWIVAPHDPTEEELLAWEQLLPNACVRLSNWENGYSAQAAPRLLLIDGVGLLSSLYAYARIAYIGGGLGKGLHNTLEAAVFGIPVLFGKKNYAKFDEVIQMERLGCAFPVGNESELTMAMRSLDEGAFYEEVCQKSASFVIQHAGATQKIMRKLEQWIKEEDK